MSKYLVAIHDNTLFDTYIVPFEAESDEDCREKLADYLTNTYKCLKDHKYTHYTDIIDIAFEKNIDISECYLASEL